MSRRSLLRAAGGSAAALAASSWLPDAVTAQDATAIPGQRDAVRVAVRSQSRMPLTNPAPLIVDVIGLYWGPKSEAEDLLVPIERVQTAESKSVQEVSFPAARAFLAAETPTRTYGIKTGFVSGPLSSDGIVTMLEWIERMPGFPSRSQESTAGLYCWGGKVNDLAPDATAFVHRNADLLFKCEALWEPQDDPDLIVRNLDWLEGYQAAMQPYLAGRAYQIFTDRSQDDWQHAYYGANFDRLVEIKRAWDPDNLFRFGQSIPLTR